MENKDLTTGNIRKQLWSLAWPMMLTMFFYNLYNLVDTYWVSEISEEAIAAVGISQISLIVMISLGFGITAGSGVIMAMNIGSKNKPEAERILGQSFVLSAILAGIFTILSLIFSHEILIKAGAGGAIYDPAREYFLIVSGGSVILFLMMSVMFAFMSQGDTATLTKLFAISTVVNIILDPILINGWGGIPAMGISGAAIATLISQTVFMILAIRLLMQPTREIRFKFSKLSFKWESVKKVLNIGFPAALTQVIFPVGLALFANLAIISFDEPGSVAFNLGFKVEFFAYLPAAGFGFAAMAIMGQSMGAGDLNRAREVFKKAVLYAFVIAAGIGLISAVFAEPIVSAFTEDAVVGDYFQSYLWIVGLSYGFLAAMMVQASAFQSINRSWPGFWIYILRVGVVAAPLGYVFTVVLGMDIRSMWLAVVIGNVVAAVLGYLWINRLMNRITPEELEQNKAMNPVQEEVIEEVEAPVGI